MFLTSIEFIRRTVFDNNILHSVRGAFKVLSSSDGASLDNITGGAMDLGNLRGRRSFDSPSAPLNEATSNIRVLKARLSQLEAERNAALAEILEADEKRARRFRRHGTSLRPLAQEKKLAGQQIRL